MAHTEADFRDILKSALERRRSRNPGYSQRAFARDLGVRPNRLCEILHGKQGLSGRWAVRIADKLGLDDRQKDHFRTLVEIKHARSKTARLAARKKLKQIHRDDRYHRLLLNDFETLAEWHSLALIELLKTNADPTDVAQLGARLGLSQASCLELLARLAKTGLVKEEAGKWTVASPDNMLPGKIPSEKVKRFHSSLLQKAEQAIWNQTLTEREFSTLIVAIDRAKIRQAKERMQKFLKKFDEDFGVASGATDVYCLGVQLFRLSEEPPDA
jgi:uncharacterized protein (TIGR02147 family)